MFLTTRLPNASHTLGLLYHMLEYVVYLGWLVMMGISIQFISLCRYFFRLGRDDQLFQYGSSTCIRLISNLSALTSNKDEITWIVLDTRLEMKSLLFLGLCRVFWEPSCEGWCTDFSILFVDFVGLGRIVHYFFLSPHGLIRKPAFEFQFAHLLISGLDEYPSSILLVITSSLKASMIRIPKIFNILFDGQSFILH